MTQANTKEKLSDLRSYPRWDWRWTDGKGKDGVYYWSSRPCPREGS